MRIFTIAFIFWVCVAQVGAQVVFQKIYEPMKNSEAWYVNQTTDGGFIMTGTTQVPNGDENVYVLKTAFDGTLQWTKIFGDLPYNDWGNSIQQTSDKGFIICGWTNSFGALRTDIYFIKIDSSGNLQWSKTVGGGDFDYGLSVCQTSDGGYIAAGKSCSFGDPTGDMYLVKLDSYGNLRWTRTFGGPREDGANSVQETFDKGFIIAGYTYSFNDPDNGNENVMVVKTDSQGTLQWAQRYGDSGKDVAYAIRQVSDSGYIICGMSGSCADINGDMYLLKTQSNGNLQWGYSYGGPKEDKAFMVQQTRDGGFFMAGYSEQDSSDYDVYAVKTFSNGHLEWSKRYGGTMYDLAFGGAQTSDGGFVLAGMTDEFGIGVDDVYLVKTDSNGNSRCHEYDVPTTVGSGVSWDNVNAQEGWGGVENTVTTQLWSAGNEITLCTNVGIGEPDTARGLILSPNPSHGLFTLSGLTGTSEIKIYNSLGEKVFSGKIFSSGTRVDLSDKPRGIYFVQVMSEKESSTQKMIIE
ncbi:MAG TPA: T9SS type A sorting domain-containing protein [Bacteroidia bacterium]|jgi:hypothetical protein